MNQVPSPQCYELLYQTLSRSIPESSLTRSPLRTFAYGVDASFYRLIPKLVVRVQSEAEVVATIRACSDHGTPYTYRAAGTSLSGQALSDSVLVQVSRLWDRIRVSRDGKSVLCEPAALGGRVNLALSHFQRKIGPDPASIDSAMIAGIAANNASGMCCGNVQDTYHTMDTIRIVFSDGSVLDTSSETGREQFAIKRRDLVEAIDELARKVKSRPALVERIRYKYRIKNTTGYCLLALIDFDDPLEIIAHLMIGSEGTLGFISEITYHTVPDPPYHGTAFVLFPDVQTACRASAGLAGTQVAAVELMDRYSLRSIENQPYIPDFFRQLDDEVTALLVEIAAGSEYERQMLAGNVKSILSKYRVIESWDFTFDKLASKRLWEIRKGLFPSLGQTRAVGTTIIIEDVAFAPEQLADAAVALRRLFGQYAYHDGVIFGHALQGNLHFVFCVDFNREEEVERYAQFMDAMTRVVTQEFDGSLKAEHGTGRNISPFLEREWGAEATAIMREIKKIFDPKGLLNPGVIFSDNPQSHITNLKLTPVSHPAIEKCTECGFCERSCPSRHLSLTPRQRIAAWREISELRRSRLEPERLHQLEQEFEYSGEATCAADGLCAALCPVGIDTGGFIKELRCDEHSRRAHAMAACAADHFSTIVWASRALLAAGHVTQKCIGAARLAAITRLARRMFGRLVPEWNQWIPRPAPLIRREENVNTGEPVIYFPSCVSRVFGVFDSGENEAQTQVIASLFEKAGLRAVYPNKVNELCCGMAFSSKGFFVAAQRKIDELTSELVSMSKVIDSVVLDTSPCATRLRSFVNQKANCRIYDLSEYLLEKVVPRLQIRKLSRPIALHIPCSLRVSGKDQTLLELARRCAEEVYVCESAACCGFAGDRGFSHPELAASALVSLGDDLPAGCSEGYSSSRTCEIGTSMQSGILFRSIAFLLDKVTEPASAAMKS